MSIPGYADIQINGYRNVDFSDPALTEADFLRTAERIFESGTYLFLPTVITSSEEVYLRNIRLMHDAVEKEGLQKQIPGIHAEGPFLSDQPGAVGCHNPAWVRKPSCAFLDKIMERTGGFIKLMTVAAENEGAEELIRHAVSLGIAVGCGHQLADYEQLQKAQKAGARTLTHLGNGIPNMIHRHKNPIWSGLACDDLTATIITDGHHLPPELIKCVIRMKGPDKVIVISDASPVAGLPPGRYHMLGNDAVLEENGLFHNPEKGCLVGSSASMSDCMKYLESLDLLDREGLEKVGYYNAVKLLGML